MNNNVIHGGGCSIPSPAVERGACKRLAGVHASQHATFNQRSSTMSKPDRFFATDSPERLIDSSERLDDQELADLLSRGWRLIDTTHRVSRAGSAYVRHRFRHVSAAPPGCI